MDQSAGNTATTGPSTVSEAVIAGLAGLAPSVAPTPSAQSHPPAYQVEKHWQARSQDDAPAQTEAQAANAVSAESVQTSLDSLVSQWTNCYMHLCYRTNPVFPPYNHVGVILIRSGPAPSAGAKIGQDTWPVINEAYLLQFEPNDGYADWQKAYAFLLPIHGKASCARIEKNDWLKELESRYNFKVHPKKYTVGTGKLPYLHSNSDQLRAVLNEFNKKYDKAPYGPRSFAYDVLCAFAEDKDDVPHFLPIATVQWVGH
jgi:hypothetical protein